nr:metallophosphoesterase family protein [Gemmatimonadaceae bacterium]
MTRFLVATLLVALLAVPHARAAAQAPLGAPPVDSTRVPAALFVTWDGDPTTTVSIDWHLHAGTELPSIAVRGPGLRGWRTVPGQPVAFPYSTRQVRRVRLTGLRPDATYRVRVAGRTYTYRTMPARLDRPIVFAEGGDTQPDNATFGATNRMVARHDVAFAVIGGDLAYSNGDPRLVAREERWFETVSRTLVTDEGRLIPVIAGIGNHEVFSARDTSAAFAEMVARTGVRSGDATYYRALHAHARDRQHGVIDVGDYLSLVLLNTGHTMPIAGEQTEWLRATLAARRAVPHLFPVYHVPAYPSVRA